MTFIGADSTRVVCPLFQMGEGGSIPTSALQLTVIEIPVEQARSLNAYWHSLLPRTSPANINGNRFVVCYGAEFESKLYAVAIWTSPIAGNRLKDGNRLIELRRFAIAPDSPKNSASRLLAVMCRLITRKFPSLIKAISYQAIDQHKGTIYKAAGWIAVASSKSQSWHTNAVRFRDGKFYREAGRAEPQTLSEKIRWEKILNASNLTLPASTSAPVASSPDPLSRSLFAVD